MQHNPVGYLTKFKRISQSCGTKTARSQGIICPLNFLPFGKKYIA